MNKILYNQTEDGDMSVIFLVEGEEVIYFDEWNFRKVPVIELTKQIMFYKELEFSKLMKDKKLLEIEKISHYNYKSFYVKLRCNYIIEITSMIYGYGEIMEVINVFSSIGNNHNHSDIISYTNYLKSTSIEVERGHVY